MTKKSIFNLDENIVAALSYLFGPFSGIFVLVMEKENKFVRFHALQSTMWFLMLMVVRWVVILVGNIFTIIPIINFIAALVFGMVGSIIALIWFISMIILIIKAFSGATFKLPIIGDVVWAQINK